MELFNAESRCSQDIDGQADGALTYHVDMLTTKESDKTVQGIAKTLVSERYNLRTMMAIP